MNAPRALRFSRHPRSERRVRGHARERGAAMVEAAIVISLLTLGLMGLMFFRAFYVKELIAARLARASVLAYSMSGCDDPVPKDWIGTNDRIDLTVSAPDANSEPATGKDVDKAATSSDSSANGFLSGLGLTGDGLGVLNPITKSHLDGKVAINSKPGVLAPSKTVFKNDVAATSYVTCGEKPKEGNIATVVKDLMGKLTGLIHN
jgi:hypothetical protein